MKQKLTFWSRLLITILILVGIVIIGYLSYWYAIFLDILPRSATTITPDIIFFGFCFLMMTLLIIGLSVTFLVWLISGKSLL